MRFGHSGSCRGRLLPDPRYDAVRVIALATLDDAEDVPDGDFATRCLLHCADANAVDRGAVDALHDVQARNIFQRHQQLQATTGSDAASGDLAMRCVVRCVRHSARSSSAP